MKHICFFITHKTLNREHADATFRSISTQNKNCVFDELYIYNSHSDELSNEIVLELYHKYNLSTFFKQVKIFPYVQDTHKSLGADVATIKSFSLNNFTPLDRILLLKSDCVLSKNFFNDVFNLPQNREVFFTAPFVCAKERIPDDEIFEYALRDKFIESDDITFFVEDQTNSSNNDFHKRPGISVTDEQIRFTSCRVNTDFSCHLISVSLLNNIIIEYQSWGGVKFYNLVNQYIGTDNSFVIHKYHDIKSENRASDREGPVESWLKS